LYTSQETHYSVFKAARYYRMECQIIPTLPNGEINYDILAATIRQQRKDHNPSSEKPIILNVNIGTTVKGAIDDIDRIVQILQQENIPREQFYIHCDGALFALMIPFMTKMNTNKTEYSNVPIPVISFATQPIDSIAVSGHKMLGCPMPCGVALCRREHITRLGQPIDYLNSIDTTIMGSRNGHAALYLWYALRTKGSLGIQEDVNHCIDTAQYLQQRLIHDVNVPCGLNPYSSTVVFERPVYVPFIQKWQLACSDDIAHVVVMPNITRTKIDQFIQEFIVTIQTHGRVPSPTDRHSPLAQLQSKLW
jgi:histidine decarboxylase